MRSAVHQNYSMICLRVTHLNIGKGVGLQHAQIWHPIHASMLLTIPLCCNWQDIHTGRGLENPVNRLYTTNAAQPFHVDDADVVGALGAF